MTFFLGLDLTVWQCGGVNLAPYMLYLFVDHSTKRLETYEGTEASKFTHFAHFLAFEPDGVHSEWACG